VIGDIVLVGTLGIFLGTLADVLLNPQQKRYLENKFLEFWNWLDDLKSKQLSIASRLVAYVRTHRRAVIIGSRWFTVLNIIIVIFGAAISETNDIGLLAFFLVLSFIGLVGSPAFLLGLCLTLTYAILGLLAAIEFYVRSSAQQAKGPIIAVTLLISGVVAIFKFYA
jgi:hypothetical protein